MKKTIKHTTLTMAGLLAGGLLMGQRNAVHAADPVATDGGIAHSIGSIKYVVDNSTTAPIDPTNPDPDKPITPTDPGHENPSAGPLSIDYVSNIKFGEQKTTGTDATYYASLDKVTDSTGKEVEVPDFVQVTDKRGSNAGWHLSVTEDTQFKNGNDTLDGALITMKNGTLSTPNDGDAPTASTEINLVPGTASDVIDATVNKGTGTWLDRFGKDNPAAKQSISMFVPGKTKKVQGEYKTTLTWTLTDSPA